MTRNLRTIHKEAGDKLGEGFDESAHVITLVFAKSGIELSCVWSHFNNDTSIEYHFTKLMGWSTSLTVEEAKQMVSFTRNAMEWAGKHNSERIRVVIEKIWTRIQAGEEILGRVVEY
jgi:hypothetical protein